MYKNARQVRSARKGAGLRAVGGLWIKLVSLCMEAF